MPPDGPAPTMRRPLQIASVIIIIVGVLVARESLALKLYSVMGPGPGFFPLGLAITIIGLALLMFANATMKPEDAAPDLLPERSGIFRLVVVMAGLVAVLFLLEPLGMRLTFFALFLLLPLFLGYRRLPIILAVATIGSFGVYEIFSKILDIPLPIGFLGI